MRVVFDTFLFVHICLYNYTISYRKYVVSTCNGLMWDLYDLYIIPQSPQFWKIGKSRGLSRYNGKNFRFFLTPDLSQTRLSQSSLARAGCPQPQHFTVLTRDWLQCQNGDLLCQEIYEDKVQSSKVYCRRVVMIESGEMLFVFMRLWRLCVCTASERTPIANTKGWEYPMIFPD